MVKQNGQVAAKDLEKTVEAPRQLSKIQTLALGAAMQQFRVAQAQLNEVYAELGLDRTRTYSLRGDGVLTEAVIGSGSQ